KDFGPGRFSRVELRFFEGTNLAFNAPLQFRPAPPGQVLVGFQVRRALADRVTLMVVIGSGLIPGGGFELRLKDFLVGGSDGQAPDKAR
ncbi:MAG: hypothetical protein JNL97_06870, partial [Verrucomicrobiales bacterium]|nr:hypothetical protein [Verrucomicrobiales bacterium]